MKLCCGIACFSLSLLGCVSSGSSPGNSPDARQAAPDAPVPQPETGGGSDARDEDLAIVPLDAPAGDRAAEAAPAPDGPPAGGGDGSSDGSPSTPGSDRLTCDSGAEGNGMHDLTAGLQADPPEWRLAPGVKAGTLTASASFASTIYGQHFPYRVYASANVQKGRPAVFMTFADGSEYIGGFHTPTVLDNLTASGDVPPAVVLFIDPPSDGDRVRTYDPPTDKYSRFLLQEIIPAVVDPTFTISKDPAAWATGGHSASAEQDWTVLWLTDRFHKFLGHNSSFGAAPTYGVDWPKTIAAAPMRDLRVSLVAAAVGRDLVDQRGDWTLINQAVARALDGKGNAYRMVIGPGGHGGPASQRDFPTALRWAFRGCKFAN
ncbi:MAG TPA: hypothetical protein VFH73_24230 [Polyangia bacterium]|jgi:enterochelin esterase family protein|nr:hypothetical protein [Polyangia bacterium]